MRYLILLLLAVFLLPGKAEAQSNCKYLTKPGAVLTNAQWTYCFQQKQDLAIAPPTPTFRQLASTNVTVYVLPTGGNDTLCNGLVNVAYSSGSFPQPCAVQSFTKAAQIAYSFDLNGFSMTISIGPGSVAGATLYGPLAGGGGSLSGLPSTIPTGIQCPLTIIGSVSSPSSVTINGGTSPAIGLIDGACANITGVSVGSTGQDAIGAYNGGFGVLAGPVQFNATGGCYTAARRNGVIGNVSGIAITLAGNASGLACTSFNGHIALQSLSYAPSTNITFAQAFLRGVFNSSINFPGNNFLPGGHTISGLKYDVESNASINTNGACSGLPGSGFTQLTNGICQ